MVGLDLGALLHLCGAWAELQQLAGETFGRFRLLAAYTKAIAALSLWNDATKARRWNEALLKEARSAIAAGLIAGRFCKSSSRF